MNYKQIIITQAQGIAQRLKIDQMPDDAIIIKKSSPKDFQFISKGDNKVLFSVSLSSEGGRESNLNELARTKITELGLGNRRFFMEIGSNDEFIEATKRLTS